METEEEKRQRISRIRSEAGRKGGKIGGKVKTLRKTRSSRRNIQFALAELSFDRRSEIQAAIPPERKSARGTKAVSTRWQQHPEAMSREEFLTRTSGHTNRTIAEMLTVSLAKVNGWKRNVNPVRIMQQDADRIRKVFPGI